MRLREEDECDEEQQGEERRDVKRRNEVNKIRRVDCQRERED